MYDVRNTSQHVETVIVQLENFKHTNGSVEATRWRTSTFWGVSNMERRVIDLQGR
jgi:hypothetical protein